MDNEPESVSDVLQKKIDDLGGMCFDHELHLRTKESRDNLDDILSLCSDQVTELFVSGDFWRDDDVKQLQECNQLSYLKISDGKRLTDETLLHLSKISSLETLNLGLMISKHTTIRGYKMLQRLPHLDILYVPIIWINYLERPAFKAELGGMMPNTIIKWSDDDDDDDDDEDLKMK